MPGGKLLRGQGGGLCREAAGVRATRKLRARPKPSRIMCASLTLSWVSLLDNSNAQNLERRLFLRDQRFDLLYEILHGHVVGLLFSASTDIHSASFGFFVAYHHEERYFLHGMLANLGVHLLVASVH